MNSTDTLRNRSPIHGFWSATGHPAIVDVAAAALPDFICVDTQHGVDLGHVDAGLFTTMSYYGVAGLVRVQSLELGSIGRALDLGAAGVVVPLVETQADAERAVHATRHAPRGGRSYGMQTTRVGPFADPPFIVLQIETKASMENVDAIAAVEGVDALYIGPADLGLSLVGEPADPGSIFDGSHSHADAMSAAFEAVISACNGVGVMPGLHCNSGEVASMAVGMGFRMTSVAADIGLVGDGLRDQLSKARARNT